VIRAFWLWLLRTFSPGGPMIQPPNEWYVHPGSGGPYATQEEAITAAAEQSQRTGEYCWASMVKLP
jgi:hypothetical protein